MAPTVIDAECFKTSSGYFMLKEVAIITVEEAAESTTMIFTPPVSWDSLTEEDQRHNSWLMKNLHGLRWEGKNRAYEDMDQILHSYVKPDDIKGAQKRDLFRCIFPSNRIINLDDIGCPRLEEIGVYEYDTSPHCYEADSAAGAAFPLQCATRKVLTLQK